MMTLKTGVCIPTLNAGSAVESVWAALEAQTCRPDEILIIDSGSTDGTAEFFASRRGVVLAKIDRASFDHGGTRQLAVKMMSTMDIVVFLTQDAVLADEDSLDKLVAEFEDNSVAAAFGRQLPRPGAGPVEAHARLFNYPEIGRVKSLDSIAEMGIKAAFISNSFAAYRCSALSLVGGFPSPTILGEDTFVAAKMILAGKKIVYCAESRVYHSHDYTVGQEFRRYFDTGVFHRRNRWIREQFGGAEGEGMRFARSELRHLMHKAPFLIPSALARTVAKFVGFRLGQLEGVIPLCLKRRLSMNRSYWNR